MIRIPPNRVKILSRDELQRYGLSEDDPYEDAARVAELAQSLGISTEEFLRRTAKMNAECNSGNDDEQSRCRRRIVFEGR
jgi:hypothetical protein